VKSAAVSKLKANLSECLSWVKGGEDVLVTDRGRPVARIVPVEGSSLSDARRMELARRGILRPGKGRIPRELLRDLPLVRVPDDTLRRVLDEEREEPR